MTFRWICIRRKPWAGGESGCGKSVTALSIMRLIKDRPRISGRDPPGRARSAHALSATDAEDSGRRISMIFQEPMTS